MPKEVIFLVDLDNDPKDVIHQWLALLNLAVEGEVECFDEGKYDATTSDYNIVVAQLDSSTQRFYSSWIGITPQIRIGHILYSSPSSPAREKIPVLTQAALQ